jgi:hypothetical protein
MRTKVSRADFLTGMSAKISLSDITSISTEFGSND